MQEDAIARVMHEMPYGLYIIGSKEPDGGPSTDSGQARVNGMMADWVMQVSFEPRLVAVAFENDSHTLGNIRENKLFTVNLLSADQAGMELARPFAQPFSGTKVKGRKADEAAKVHYKLEGLAYSTTERGCPVLNEALGWFECEVDQFIVIGDHTLVVGRVLGGRVEREGEPLTSSFTGWTYSG
jgi:flavin reductase (DIM6/NTAB) family NADH-FMN oxidoreductase RutF